MPHRLAGLVLVAALASFVRAEDPAAAPQMPAREPKETIRLWEAAAPGALGTAEHDVPVVAWWPARSTTPTAALVICPGGAYGALADHEGTDYAKWLNTRGISCFVLRYRLGSKGYRHPLILGDVARAVRLVRHDHQRFGVDPARVGVMGSSAGGHLALSLCLHGDDGDPAATDPVDRQASRPAVGVLCYPVVSMLPEKTHEGSRRNLLGDAPDEQVVRDLSGEIAAHDKLPPLFIWHTFDDAAVKLEPILELSLKLKSIGRPHELHVYESGRHGLGLGVQPYDASKTLLPWTTECARWLSTHGF